MTNTMNSILSRVLSQEIAHQERWKKDDIAMGFSGTDRDEYIIEIKRFMESNKIPFNQDWYSRI